MTINSLSQTLVLLNDIKTQQTQLATLQQQISTEKKSSTYSGLTPTEGSASLALRAQIARFDSYTSTVTALDNRLSAADTALTSSNTALTSLLSTVSSVTAVSSSTAADMASSAQGTLAQLVSNLNVTVDGQPVFSGVSGTSTLQSASSMISGLKAAIAGGTTTPSAPFASAAAAQQAVAAYFGSSGAALSTWFQPGSSGVAGSAVAISDGRTVDASLTALPSSTVTAAAAATGGTGYAVGDTITLPASGSNAAAVLTVTSISAGGVVTGVSVASAGSYSGAPTNPVSQQTSSGSGTGATFTLTTAAGTSAIQSVVQAVAAIAAIQPGDFQNSSDYQNFLNQSYTTLKNATDGLSAYDGQVGILKSTIDAQSTVNQSALTLAQTSLNTVENIDSATAITNLDNLQTQLQATYKVTATLKGLSLVNYI